MSVCPLQPSPSGAGAYCTRHFTIHKGRMLTISQTDNEWGEAYRKFWDEKLSYVRFPYQVIEPYEIITIDGNQLTEHRHQSNNSIIKFKGRTLMMYRTGWVFASLNICELDENFNVKWNRPIHFDNNPVHVCAQEDPKFFIFNEQLYFSYVGLITNKYGGNAITSQMIGKLDEDFCLEKYIYPHYKYRETLEKNWQFFECPSSNKLYSVYSIDPHITTKVNVDKHIAELAYQTKIKLTYPWNFGNLRGGANPILHNNEFYSFFHWVEQPPPGIIKSYTMGVYTFSPEPPFQILRISAGSILVNRDENRPKDWHINTTFPCGAYIEDDSWCVSYGSYDSFCTLGKFKINELEKVMVRVT